MSILDILGIAVIGYMSWLAGVWFFIFKKFIEK